MESTHGWLPDARLAWILLYAWISAILIHGLWRSLGDAKPDPIRSAGPF